MLSGDVPSYTPRWHRYSIEVDENMTSEEQRMFHGTTSINGEFYEIVLKTFFGHFHDVQDLCLYVCLST